MRSASWRTSVVSRPASPGATSFGPPEKPAKKCGSVKPVTILKSASSHARLSQTGTLLPKRPSQVSEPSSRASWLTTATESTRSSPSIARSSSSVLPRCVPVATSRTMSSSRTIPSSSARIAGTTTRRGCGLVPSQIAIATVCPRRRSSRRGGPATGARSASTTQACSSRAASRCWGVTTVASSGTSTPTYPAPYATSTLIAHPRPASGKDGGARIGLPADDGPDRTNGLVADRAQPVRRGRVEGDRRAGPELVLVEADCDAQPAADHVAVLLAAVPHQRVCRARLAAGLVDDVEELDERVAGRRQPLPVHAGGQIDDVPVLGRRHRPAGVGRRLPATRAGTVVEHVAHRQPEHVDERVERRHGRVDHVALDLGDEARRDTDPPRDLSQADAEPLALGAQPRTDPGGLGQALVEDGLGHVHRDCTAAAGRVLIGGASGSRPRFAQGRAGRRPRAAGCRGWGRRRSR